MRSIFIKVSTSINKFSPGEVARVRVKGLTYTSDGFSTGGAGQDGGLLVFEWIDLVTFPSFNDFLGKTSTVYHGDLITIIDYVGRPMNISGDTSWFRYDIYSVLVNGQIRQIFSQNLERVVSVN